MSTHKKIYIHGFSLNFFEFLLCHNSTLDTSRRGEMRTNFLSENLCAFDVVMLFLVVNGILERFLLYS